MDQAAEDAPPPKLAPDKVIAEAPWHFVSGPPAFTVGIAVIFTVLVAIAAAHAPEVFVVRVNVTGPLKFAVGVNVTASGVEVCNTLLKVPVPKVIDHAAVAAPPPKLVPLKVMGVGDED